TRTVGWLTSVYPVRARKWERGAGEELKRVKEEMRRVPGRGIGYGLLRYMRKGEGGEGVRKQERARVSFNYHGQVDQVVRESEIFTGRRGSGGEGQYRGQEREKELEVGGMVVE